MTPDSYTFLIIPDDVLEDPRVDWPAKIIWATVWSFSRQRLPCFVSLDEMARRCHRSRRQVSDYIKQLRDLGWIDTTGMDGRRRTLTAIRPSTIATGRHHSDGPPPSRPAATIATDRTPATRPTATQPSDPPPPIKKEEKNKEKIIKQTPGKHGTKTNDRPRDLDEVRDYFDQIGGTDPEQFFDYWTSAGWRRKSGPIRDWRATARTWTRSPYRRGSTTPRQLDAGLGSRWADQ
jgi:biotin operon repressor